MGISCIFFHLADWRFILSCLCYGLLVEMWVHDWVYGLIELAGVFLDTISSSIGLLAYSFFTLFFIKLLLFSCLVGCTNLCALYHTSSRVNFYLWKFLRWSFSISGDEMPLAGPEGVDMLAMRDDGRLDMNDSSRQLSGCKHLREPLL